MPTIPRRVVTGHDDGGVSGFTADGGEALAERVTALGPGAMVYRHLEVSSEAQWADLAARLAADGGPVRGLVKNAGVPYRARLMDMDVAGLGPGHRDQPDGGRCSAYGRWCR
jgi:NAD(P)-dependent dehydrogenase (short-subunit alcohol dehydrogenase family)